MEGVSDHLRGIVRWVRKLYAVLVLVFVIIPWLSAVALSATITLGLVPRSLENIVYYLTIVTPVFLPLVLMFGSSADKVLEATPEVSKGEFLKLVGHDILKCIETGFFLLIRVGLMSLAPITIITAVLPLGSFKTVLSFCIAASVPVAACFALSNYEDVEDPPRKFIDRFGKELHEWVPFGRHVKTGIDPRDMWLIALPVITAAAATATIVYALASIIRTYLSAWPPLLIQALVSILILSIFIVPLATVWAFRQRNTRKIRSEEVKKHFTALMIMYTMIIVSPAISLMVKYKIILIPQDPISLVYMITIYILSYFVITNYLRSTGLITEKLPTINKENQKT